MFRNQCLLSGQHLFNELFMVHVESSRIAFVFLSQFFNGETFLDCRVLLSNLLLLGPSGCQFAYLLLGLLIRVRHVHLGLREFRIGPVWLLLGLLFHGCINTSIGSSFYACSRGLRYVLGSLMIDKLILLGNRLCNSRRLNNRDSDSDLFRFVKSEVCVVCWSLNAECRCTSSSLRNLRLASRSSESRNWSFLLDRSGFEIVGYFLTTDAETTYSIR